MKTVSKKVDLKDLYDRWLAAKGRYEMSQAMHTEPEHKNNFKKLYIALSNELNDALNAHGYTSRVKIEDKLVELDDNKNTHFTLIKGGKQ